MDSLLHGAKLGLSGMNLLDWVIALTLAISTITAFMNGLIRSLLGLVGLIAGVMAAAWYAPRFAGWLIRWITPRSLAELVAFVLILAGVTVLASVAGRLLRGACSAIGLGFFDRLGGAVFGLVRGVLLLAALLLPLMPYLQQLRTARESMLLPYLLPASHGISFVVPRDLRDRIPASDWMQHTRRHLPEAPRPRDPQS